MQPVKIFCFVCSACGVRLVHITSIACIMEIEQSHGGLLAVQETFQPFSRSPFFYFFSFFIFSPLYAVGNCAVLHGLYIYIWKGLIHHPKSIQERPIDIVGEKFFAAGCMDAAVQKIYIYIIYTQKFVSYIILYGRKERRKRNGEEEKKTENPLLNHDLLVVCSIILSVFRSADSIQSIQWTLYLER